VNQVLEQKRREHRETRQHILRQVAGRIRHLIKLRIPERQPSIPPYPVKGELKHP
jgi:hypothetical protein